jgi:hypothetical protein
MRKRIFVVAAIGVFVAAAAVAGAAEFFSVQPRTYDPAQTSLVSSGWVSGIGCPTSQPVATYPSTSATGTYGDPACPTGDSRDRQNQGLLLSKEGPTSNDASAIADIQGVRGTVLTELGYDIRKPGSPTDARGSHCGAGAPRFNITLVNGNSYFIGCNSPPAVSQSGDAWQRLRWGGSSPLMAYNATTGTLDNIAGQTVKSLQIVFDEGTDTGPDNFGLAVLDNIDVNGHLVGHGSRGTGGDSGDNGQGDQGNGHDGHGD